MGEQSDNNGELLNNPFHPQISCAVYHPLYRKGNWGKDEANSSVSLWSDLDFPDPVQSSVQLLDMHAQGAVRQLGLYGFIGERWFVTACVEMGACCPSLQIGLHLVYRRCSQVPRCSIFGVSSLQTKHLLNCVTLYNAYQHARFCSDFLLTIYKHFRNALFVSFCTRKSLQWKGPDSCPKC